MIKVNNQTKKQFSTTREQKAKQILKQGNPEILDENTYIVPSQFDSSKKYQVTYFDSYSCSCPDFEKRCNGKGLYCKHIKAILLFKKLKNRYDTEELSKDISPAQIVLKYGLSHEEVVAISKEMAADV